MKVSVIGAGMVGTDIVSYLFNVGNFSEIVLVDIDKEKSYAEMMDFRHTQSLFYTKNTKLTFGDYKDCKDSDVVVITAGVQVKKGDTRESVAQANSEITISIVKELEKYTLNSILIFVTNPVDIVTYFALKKSKFPKERIMSAGTLLDSSRLSYYMGMKFNIDPKNINAYVLGEHGKSCVIPWSLCNIFGMDFDTFADINNYERINKEEMKKEVLESGYDIFLKKGNTNHGIAASTYRIVRAIAVNENSILPVGSYIEKAYGVEDVVMGVPAIINKHGVSRVLDLKLSKEEQEELKRSADFLKNIINQVKL
jgi:L-lactate dehydrogenase